MKLPQSILSIGLVAAFAGCSALKPLPVTLDPPIASDERTQRMLFLQEVADTNLAYSQAQCEAGTAIPEHIALKYKFMHSDMNYNLQNQKFWDFVGILDEDRDLKNDQVDTTRLAQAIIEMGMFLNDFPIATCSPAYQQIMSRLYSFRQIKPDSTEFLQLNPMAQKFMPKAQQFLESIDDDGRMDQKEMIDHSFVRMILSETRVKPTPTVRKVISLMMEDIYQHEAISENSISVLEYWTYTNYMTLMYYKAKAEEAEAAKEQKPKTENKAPPPKNKAPEYSLGA